MISLGGSHDGLLSRPFSTPDLLRTAFTDAGFEDVRVERQGIAEVYPDAEAWWRSDWQATKRDMLDAMDEPTRARFKSAAIEHLAAFTGPEGILIPRAALVATARRMR